MEGAEHRPRMDTLHWAAASTMGCIVLAIGTKDATYLFPAAMAFALMLQCSQRIVIDGRYAHRMGLRPVTLDLNTAEVVHQGSSWWRQLFLCGPMLQIRDADGNRLYLESWLWDAATRDQLVERATAKAHP